MYWYSMINIPGKDQFPRGPAKKKGNGISANIKDAGGMGRHGEERLPVRATRSASQGAMRTVPKEFGHRCRRAGGAATQSGQALTQNGRSDSVTWAPTRR